MTEREPAGRGHRSAPFGEGSTGPAGWLAGALGSLPARERYIVTERKLRDEPRTLESLAEELGLSKERVRQLESAAFAKMRRHLLANHADVRSLLA